MTSLIKKISIGVITLVLVLILIGAAFSGWRAAVRSGIESGPIQILKSIAEVETQYFNAHKQTFGTFDQLVNDGFDRRFSSDYPSVDDYVYTLRVISKTATQPSSYTLNADPVSGRTGVRHFYIDSTSKVIRVNADQPAGPTDPPLVQ
jgi:hypothetical protein